MISVIIPAFNEEHYIGATLTALQAALVDEKHEIIVVDNGSTDGTRTIVANHQATCIDFPEGTVAAVRNCGVKASSGSVLVFIDADVVVDSCWAQELKTLIAELGDSPLQVSGSRCLPPDQTFWLNRYWYCLLNEYTATYINSGHMITTRELFNAIGGFTEDLETAEDYDFCMKAEAVGGVIKNRSALKVIHHGYPRTLKSFIAREFWHGTEDLKSWASFKASKMAWLATLQLCIGIVGLASLFVFSVQSVALMYVLLSYSFCLSLSWYKFGYRSGGHLLVTPYLFHCYLFGRGLVVLNRLRFGAKVTE